MQPTSKQDPALNNIQDLFASIQRAGPIFTGQATIRPEGEGYQVTFQLAPSAFAQNETGKRAQVALNNYVRAFLQEDGWRVKTAGFRRGYYELCYAPAAASKAASRASQKPKAIL